MVVVQTGGRVERSISSDRVGRLPSGRAPERRSLEGRFVTVEPLNVDQHAEALYRASHETAEAKQIWSYLPEGPFDQFSDFKPWLAAMAANPERAVFAIRDRATARIGGMASYLDIRPSHASIEVGYLWFAPFLQRTRQATEAPFLMLSYAFDDLGYRRMQWRCNALNDKSRAAAVRLGFTYEGIFYQHMVVKGCNRDTAWYSILDGEWPRIRANLEAWLAPSNFDSEGRQRLSLSALKASADGSF
jgi:RimJ/RimL family protein N-acetyltransferase